MPARAPISPHPSQFSTVRGGWSPGPGNPAFKSEAVPVRRSIEQLKKDFGFSEDTTKGNDAAARAGLFANQTKLQELPRSGTRHGRTEGGHGEENIVEDWFEPAGTPTRAQSARERGFEDLQIQQAMDREARLQSGIAQEQEMSARLQRQAAIQAWEQTYKMPFSEKNAMAMAELVQKHDQDADTMADLDGMKADMDFELAAADKLYPIDPTNGPGQVTRDRELGLIRQKYMLDMNHLLSVLTRRQIEMGKKGQPAAAEETDELGLQRR